jgi:hypothetical protein
MLAAELQTIQQKLIKEALRGGRWCDDSDLALL